MADKVFSVTEMRRTSSAGGASAYTPSGSRFEWTAANKAVPHDSWKMPLKLRTSRTDLPGAEEPVEQILGWNFESFAVEGLWDDRWLGEGGAYATMKEFEEMVQRGNMVRFEFEQVTMHGLITDFVPDYKRADYIRYSFTVSPHFRQLGQSVRGAPPAPVVDPRVAVEQALGHAQTLETAHALAGGAVAGASKAKLKALVPSVTDPARPAVPPFQPTDSLLSDVGGLLGDMFEVIGDATGAIQETIVDPLADGATGLMRLSQRFASIKTTAHAMLDQVASAAAESKMAYQTAVGLLEYEVWSRGIAANARRAWLDADGFQKDLARRSEPRAKALYSPHKGESVYGISSRFYGTPHEWRRIMERNNLTSLTLAGTETLIIPEIT